MITLAIETSTPSGSAAVFDGGEVVRVERFEAGRNHSSQLFVTMERLLAGMPRVERVVAGLGPGSYAGVRIAISAAIGYSVAVGAEAVGLPSIVTLDEGDYVALGDARRESYSIAVVRRGQCIEGPLLVTAPELAARLEWAAAAGLPVFASEPLRDAPGVELRFPCAERLGRLAAAGESALVRGLLEPMYLRDPHITQPGKKSRVAGVTPQTPQDGP